MSQTRRSFIRFPSFSPGGCDPYAPHAVLVDGPRHQAGGLDVIGEIAHVFRGLAPAPGDPDRLLDRRDLPFEDARAGQRLAVRRKPGLEARERLELLVEEQLEGRLNPLDAHQARVLQRAREIQVVGALLRDGHAYAFGVYFLNILYG